jgi:hypothetical protein
MTPAPSFLDDLKRATERSTAAENDFRRDIAQRIKAESEEIAVAGATAMLRARLGWGSDSEARDAVVTRFTPVAQAMFASLAPSDDEDAAAPDVIAALAEFERWYGETHPNPFWILFENYMPETPVVDF